MAEQAETAHGAADLLISSVFDYIHIHASRLREQKADTVLRLQNALRQWIAYRHLEGKDRD
jgi:hypothetical protein